MGTRPVAAVAVSMLAVASSPALAQEGGDSRAATRTVTACVALESDYVRPGTPVGDRSGATALVLTDASSGRPLLNVTGLREAELASHVGRRVEITGTVEPPRTTPVLSTADGSITGSVAGERPPAAGLTPDGAAAHEPSDALGNTVAAGRVAQPTGVDDPAYVLGLLPGLRATSFRQMEGACVRAATGGDKVTAQAATAAQQPAATPRRLPVSQEPVTERVVARGCLVRQTAGGTALTSQEKSADPLVLADAALVTGPVGGARGAVPGSAPSDAGSGTVPRPAPTGGEAPVDAAATSFQLVMTEAQRTELAPRVGEQIEVTGEVEQGSGARTQQPRAAPPQAQPGPGRVAVAPVDVAHVSTPAQRLTVRSFRAVGGTCH